MRELVSAGCPSSSSVLKQPEDVAIGVGDGCHEAAATYVAHGLLHGGTGSGHLGQLRLDVRHLPVGHRTVHALWSTARQQPDVLARGLEPDVILRVGLRRDAEHAAYTALAVARSDTGCSTVLIPSVEEPVMVTPEVVGHIDRGMSCG